MKYISKNRKKYYLKVHLIMVIKYRKPLLYNNEIDNSVKLILTELSNKYDFNIESMESDVNHIHLLIEYPPNISVTSIVRVLKQQSTYRLWLKNELLLKKYFWKEKTFWSDGYFVSSIGENEDVIHRYIINQGK
jgi:putative transposase